MTLQDPSIDRTYWFVRVEGGQFCWLAYQRYRDGSATTATEDSETIWEGDDDAWRMALAKVESDGFVLRNIAVATQLIDDNSLPPKFLRTGYGTID